MRQVALTAKSVDGEGYAELSDSQAIALAQLCKRITYSDCRTNAVSDEEAYQMIQATDKLGAVLARAGYNPR